MIPYGRYGNGYFCEDESGFIIYVHTYHEHDKPWDWSCDSNYKRQEKKNRLRKKLYGNMTGQTTKHEYSRLNFTKRLRKKLLQRQLEKQTN